MRDRAGDIGGGGGGSTCLVVSFVRSRGCRGSASEVWCCDLTACLFVFGAHHSHVRLALWASHSRSTSPALGYHSSRVQVKTTRTPPTLTTKPSLALTLGVAVRRRPRWSPRARRLLRGGRLATRRGAARSAYASPGRLRDRPAGVGDQRPVQSVPPPPPPPPPQRGPSRDDVDIKQ